MAKRSWPIRAGGIRDYNRLVAMNVFFVDAPHAMTALATKTALKLNLGQQVFSRQWFDDTDKQQWGALENIQVSQLWPDTSIGAHREERDPIT